LVWHVGKTPSLCDLPAEPMTLVIRDDRGSSESAAFAGLGEVLKRDGAVLNSPVGNAVGAGIAGSPFQIAERSAYPVLPLGLRQQLLPGAVSVDSASEGEVPADFIFE